MLFCLIQDGGRGFFLQKNSCCKLLITNVDVHVVLKHFLAYYAVLMIMYNQASEASQELPSGSMTEGGTMASGEEKMTTATGNVFMEAIEMTAAGVV